MDEGARDDLVLGMLSTIEDGFLLPLSSYGMVYRYSRDGEHVLTYGHKGTTTAELAFPVSATITGSGVVAVLDKQRFVVVCYSPEGKFAGEFGGKGRTPGWFYFPSFIDSDDADRVMISQVFLNRVQICRIPEAINTHLESIRQPESEVGAIDANADSHKQLIDKTESADLVGHSQHFPTKGGL